MTSRDLCASTNRRWVCRACSSTPTKWLGLFGREHLASDAGVPAGRSGFSGVSLAHNVSSRDEVDATLAQAGAAGATIVMPARNTSWGGYAGCFTDPDGHLWEVAWNPHLQVGPAV
jgi:uncharacterized protein